MKKVLMLIILLITVLLVFSCTNKVQEVTDSTVTEEVENSETITTTGVTGDKVVIENDKFMPTDLLVESGTTVEWVNKDSVDHTVTFENGDLDEKMVVGATTTYTFTEAGTFGYFCQLHPGMQGSVIVS
jgi:plastocyanin